MASQTHDDKNHDKDAPKPRAAHATAAETKAAEENDKARANDSVGCQVILDPASDAALAARGGAGDTIEENTAVRNASLPRIIGLSHDTVGGTVTGKMEAPKLHRPVPWYEPPAAVETEEKKRAEAIAEIVSP
jgi:hypothetical protein